MDNKLHFKMYKKGKQWMIGGIVTAALSFGVANFVQSPVASADEVSDTTSAVNSASSASDTTSTSANDNVASSATSTASTNTVTATSADGTSVTDDNTNSSNVTLTHGDNSTRNVTVSVPVSEGDTVTVTVPYIFSASTDQDTTGEYYTVTTSSESVSNPGYITSKSFANTTFTYTMTGSRSVEFNVKLTPTVSDWSFLTPGSQFQVVVRKNGQDVGYVTYTIDDPATITSSNLSLDQNQTTNLVTGQKYAIGLNLANNGTNDGDNFAGTTVVNVPDGWLLDTSGNYAYGLTSNTTQVGDTLDTFNDLSTGGVTVSQDGGAGTPVTITFNTAKSSLNSGEIILWGTYTKELSADENTFTTSTTYYSTNTSGEQANNGTLTTNSTNNLGIAVTNTENASIQAELKPKDGEIFTDNGTADGSHQADDNQYDYQDGRTLVINNNGNVAQTNVNVHLDLEPGTVLNGGNGSYSLAFTSTSENQPGIITITTTDGKTYSSSPVYVSSNVNSWVWGINDDAVAAGVAKDGSNIASIDISYKNLEAGTSLRVSFANNSILSSATSKQAGDTATYAYQVTSDQDTTGVSGQMNLTIADPANKAVTFTGQVESQPSGSYQPTSTDGGNTATIVYNFRSNNTSDDSSSYLVTIPEGFDVTDTSQLHLYQNNEEYTDGTIEDLGYVGVNGERMFKVTLATTPSYASPIYLKGATADSPITIVANEDQLPATYSYRNGDTSNGTAMSLIMAINDQNQFSNNSWDEETLTLKDGSTYNVILSSTGWYSNYTEASYSFTYPSTYSQLNGIKSSTDNKYTTSSKQAVSLNYSDNQDVTNTTGTIRLTNILTDKSTSAYSNNVINLPSVENGDSATLQLTGPATDTTTSGNVSDVQVLYSTSYVTDPADTSTFVSADQITDWSQVKAVMLKSGTMEPSAVAATYLPFEVTAMQDGVTNTTVSLPEYFVGDHSGVTYSLNTSLKVNIQRYVDVITNWVTQADDGTQTAIKDPTTETVQSNSAYTTSGLAAIEIPANYHLLETPSNATGTTNATNVNVTYVYVANTTTSPVSKAVSQNVEYKGAGSATPATNTQSYTFAGTTTTNDVTGSSSTAWNEDSHSFDSVATPVVTGYYADQASVDGATVTPDSDDVTTTVTYHQLGSIVPVDENGNEIATPVTYNNDPSDPTKAATTDVPTIPGWTTTTTSVDPTDPGADTKVVYTPIVMPSPSNDSQDNPDNSSSKTITDYTDYTTHTITTSYTDQDQLLTTTTNSTAESNGQGSAQLPQTGNDEHAQSLLGLAGISMLGLLGYGFASKKKRQ